MKVVPQDIMRRRMLRSSYNNVDDKASFDKYMLMQDSDVMMTKDRAGFWLYINTQDGWYYFKKPFEDTLEALCLYKEWGEK